MRPDTTIEGLAKLKPAFAKDGFVTAGNASGIVDGAAMLVVTSAENAEKKDKKPLGRIVSWGITGCDPEIMGIGPVPATKMALERAEMSLDDIDLIEINEAFAGQILAVAKELGIDKEKLNVNGGAIALGHPLGGLGDAPPADAPVRAAPAQGALRPGLGVHRRRPGNRHDRGVIGLTMTKRGAIKIALVAVFIAVIAGIYFSPLRDHLSRAQIRADVGVLRSSLVRPGRARRGLRGRMRLRAAGEHLHHHRRRGVGVEVRRAVRDVRRR